ncbi:DUF4968 domain-containing protein [Pedobacter petrophilus]|uniref:DUF4968 domain-containing protein n=1 Tax=Pedobacter petrophilus TaxID=1908241 RepID=A0A7K0FYZ4_9SPHI|nr:DUF4968 domain-containing protein [Pedobacter petrophilus]MRX76788.1 DUF4968 domain-containing protein [Pedobacter petrophilus]
MRKHTSLLTTMAILLSFPMFSFSQNLHYQKTNQGIIVRPELNSANAGKQIRIDVISDQIIHTVISPTDQFSTEASLMVIPVKANSDWTVTENADQIQLKTRLLLVKVNAKTGQIQYQHLDGQNILEEKAQTSRSFSAVSNDGEAGYQLTQAFYSPADEALYGLGQHQDELCLNPNNN